ncbi:MAG: 4Fe-4S binding protein, partial [Candidatus Omnitrophica bacterium]|nr:4Fe-4S binding protein [Candidatus Omnitrophota bacterium]
MAIEIIAEQCVGCRMCLKACPFGAIEIMNKVAVMNDKCVQCGACVSACKFEAIIVRKKEEVDTPEAHYKDIWVFAEQKKGVIQSVVYELLGEGKKLAQKKNQKLVAVLLGDKVKNAAADLVKRGADIVYVLDAPQLKNYQDDIYSECLTKLITMYKPEVMLTGATAIGRSLIPRVAVKLKTGLTADCTGLDFDE